MKHLSIRVPWHDRKWDGTVCGHASLNDSCLVLDRTRELRDDEAEDELAGTSFSELDPTGLPPCVRERGTFMSAREVVAIASHPYAATSQPHQHLKPTPLRIPAYAAGCVPFRRMLRKHAVELSESLDLTYDDDLEERARKLMGFDADWVQDGRNQRALLDSFFGAIEPETSLCFFYAKKVPLSEEGNRVLIGAGRVLHVGDNLEYANSEQGPFPTLLWERMVQHSVRPDHADGFILPYHELIELLRESPSDEAETFVAPVPEDAWGEFSYGSEHVSNDSAIVSLVACRQLLERTEEVLPTSRKTELDWVDARLADLWRLRGPCPGLGAALTAFGVERGTSLVQRIAPVFPEGDDPWSVINRAFENPKAVAPELEQAFGENLCRKWAALPEKRRSLLKLLSRFELTTEQAERFYQPTEREKAGVEVTDAELLADPYLLYTEDRRCEDAIPVAVVDRGAFPVRSIRDAHPLDEPSGMQDALDKRRVRALLTSILERASHEGDTLRVVSQLISEVRDLPLDPPCPLDEDQVAIQDYSPTIVETETGEGAKAFQLHRLAEAGALIRSAVERRLGGKSHAVEVDWGALLEDHLPAAADADEERARKEKAAALEVLARGRISVLIGKAGTGKTTMLEVLCSVPEIRSGGILLLAPTGKARVQLSKRIDAPAMTVAQVLLPSGRYDPQTGQFRLSEAERIDLYHTVIVDESSMLTEEQLAAVIDGLKGVQRLILVGDPRQLPPIGSGRPFVDVVARLEPKDIEGRFPRCADCYAELLVPRRPTSGGDGKPMTAGNRADLLLAEWFSGQSTSPGADEIWARLRPAGSEWLRDVDETLRVGSWSNVVDLRAKLVELLGADLELGSGEDAEQNFERSLGGSLFKDYMYFWREREGREGAASHAEDWQVFSPVRGQPFGVREINRFLQKRYRRQMLDFARRRGKRLIPKPMGTEEIVYGDKVINVENLRMYDFYPREEDTGYVANGEIGIVVGQFRTRKMTKPPKKLKVEFSSQLGTEFGYGKWAFGEEGAPKLELAYAITVHKAQGSEFDSTYLIVPDSCPVLSRELLYTALTRQRRRITVLHQGDVAKLKELAQPEAGESATRLTNLFRKPTPIAVGSRFLDEGLIHRTERGELMRSKSEVIIANYLYNKKIDYSYERKLEFEDGSYRYPDFTIEDDETGETVYWEHLGMLGNADYRKRWERKLAWYREHLILEPGIEGKRAGTLYISADDPQGGIDVPTLVAPLEKLLGI